MHMSIIIMIVLLAIDILYAIPSIKWIDVFATYGNGSDDTLFLVRLIAGLVLQVVSTCWFAYFSRLPQQGPGGYIPAPMETAPVELTPVATTAEATAINPLESSLAHATPVSQSPVAAPPIVAVDSTVVAPVTKKTASKVAAEPAPLQHSFGLSPPPGPNSTPPPHDAT